MAREGSHRLPLPFLPEVAPRHLLSEHLLSSIFINWQNMLMLLRTKKKISQRIQSGRSYDRTFPSRYTMRKLGLFK